tara:strand:- start:4071 stop:4760 length:690 start_codon:yes stop_codon:yes gene_type:complete
MSTFDLWHKRHHVRKYKDKVPDKKLIEEALWQTWKTTPTKNNAMPYKVFVFGPEHKKEKVLVHEMVHKNHISAENTAVRKGLSTRTEGGVPNPFYEHIKLNPYLICIHAQPRQPNEFYREQIEKGMFFDQMHESYVDNFIDTSAVEVGLFLQQLTGYVLEKNLDISYTSCFYRDAQKWRDVGLDHAKWRPIILASIGYAEKYRYEVIKEDGRTHQDLKPEYEEMIEWVE